jgi:hypothetical protein
MLWAGLVSFDILTDLGIAQGSIEWYVGGSGQQQAAMQGSCLLIIYIAAHWGKFGRIAKGWRAA